MSGYRPDGLVPQVLAVRTTHLRGYALLVFPVASDTLHRIRGTRADERHRAVFASLSDNGWVWSEANPSLGSGGGSLTPLSPTLDRAFVWPPSNSEYLISRTERRCRPADPDASRCEARPASHTCRLACETFNS